MLLLFLNNYKEFKKYCTEEFNVKEVSPNQLIKFCQDVGMELDCDNIDTNGWQLDYWIKAKYKNKKFLISGCAWDGTASIERA